MLNDKTIITLYDSLPESGSLVNKDVAGGYGNISYYGEGIIPKLAAFAKKFSTGYPPLTLGYLAAILKKNNARTKNNTVLNIIFIHVFLFLSLYPSPPSLCQKQCVCHQENYSHSH